MSNDPPVILHTLRVVGEGVFPMELLTSERCWPADGSSHRGLTLQTTRTLTFKSPFFFHHKAWSSRGWMVTS